MEVDKKKRSWCFHSDACPSKLSTADMEVDVVVFRKVLKRHHGDIISCQQQTPGIKIMVVALPIVIKHITKVRPLKVFVTIVHQVNLIVTKHLSESLILVQFVYCFFYIIRSLSLYNKDKIIREFH